MSIAPQAGHTRPFVRDIEYYDDRARALLEVIGDGAAATLEQVRSWHPELAGASDETIRSAPAAGAFTLADARLVYAREHGFESWDRFAAHVERLAAGEATEPFMEVFEAGERGDWRGAAALLEADPELVHARGTNGNTLLNLACSLAACPPSQVATETTDAAGGRSGADRPAPLRLLLEAGADPNQANDRGWTPLHQAGYRNDPEMAALLLDSGADPALDAHGEGGTPLAVALFWGHREAPELLAAAGIVPENLRVAAGLGRTDLVRRCFTPDGRLTPAAGAGRGFYRPHSGFPSWRPSDDPQEVLDEALVWAAKAGRVDAMSLLVERGARVGADPYRGTPLLWAAAKGRLEATRWLLDHGADVNQRATFGGPTHGQGVTALHLAAQDGRRSLAELLVGYGADPSIEDELYESTPAGWAAHFGRADLASFLNALKAR